MKLFSDKAFIRIFFISAIWNFSASIPGFAFPRIMIPIVFGPSASDLILNNTYAYIGFHFTMFSVLLFALGYYIVYLDITKNHGIVLLGAIGKFFFFSYYTYEYLRGNATLFLLSMVTVDMIFGFIFLHFLWLKRSKV